MKIIYTVVSFITLVVLFLCGGGNFTSEAQPQNTNFKTISMGYDILTHEVTIDSCEYIICQTNHGVSIIHKPRCRKCNGR